MPRLWRGEVGHVMAHLYILKNDNNKYYIGITEVEVTTRLVRHNRGDVKSTKTGRPWYVIHIEDFVSMNEARKREKQIKSWKSGNAFKKLICGQGCGIV